MVYHIFAYLNKHENVKVVFDMTMVELANPNVFKKVDWSDVYDMGDIKGRTTAKDAGATGTKCKDVSVCGCRSRTQQSYKMIAHWSFSPECTYCYSMVVGENALL